MTRLRRCGSTGLDGRLRRPVRHGVGVKHARYAVLQVPVPELEAFVLPRHRHYDADYVSTDPAFVHAHVTALGPLPAGFLADHGSAVAAIAAEVPPFDFRLDRVVAFPDGLLHLAPEPDDGFRELTRRLVAAFPQWPPYAGKYLDTVPHLTLDQTAPGVSTDSTQALLGDLVPVTCTAERLDLAWWEPRRCRVLASWPLGG